MGDLLERVLSVTSVEEYALIRGAEYLFHDAVDQRKLDALLAKFPQSQPVGTLLKAEVLHFSPLEDGWQEKLLNEVQALARLIPEGSIELPVTIELGQVDYDTDTMSTLRGEMGRAMKRQMVDGISPDQRVFLNDFFYCVDFTHWTKWAIMVCYTKIEALFPTILQARRNDVDFCLDGEKVIWCCQRRDP